MDFPKHIMARIDYDGTWDGPWFSLESEREVPCPPGSYFRYVRADHISAQDELLKEMAEALRAIRDYIAEPTGHDTINALRGDLRFIDGRARAALAAYDAMKEGRG
jgi:hypothetical protein